MKIRPPFQNMTSAKWQNLAIGSLITLYIIQVILDLAWGNTFGNLGIDFGSFWSAGYVANHFGYANVYDLHLMEQVQIHLVPGTATEAFAFRVIPTPYLAIFIVPFQLLSLLPPRTAAWIWIALNFLALLLYLRYFISKTGGLHQNARLLALVMVSAPVFLDLFTGQINVWLAICAGEALRAFMLGKSFRAGLWLGGLLLKPQVLIILVPALLLQRAIRTLAGLATSGAAIIGVSFLLSGLQGFGQLARLWLGYAGGLPTNDIQLMMNWRMIGIQLGHLSRAPTSLGIAISGAVITFLAAMYLWMRPLRPESPQFTIAFAGSLAATGAVAWHSHVHMAIMILPALIYLHLSQAQSFHNKLEWWVFLPAGLYFVRIVLASSMHAGILPANINDFIDLLNGIGLFALNLYLLGWAIKQTRSVGNGSLEPISVQVIEV
jgi:hypothetical protein